LSINTFGHRVGNVYSFRLAITGSASCRELLSLLRQRGYSIVQL